MPETPDVPTDSTQEVVIPAEPLKELLTKLLVKKGMFKAEAEIGAARLVESDLRGIHSHGSRAISRYLDAMDLGNIDPRARITTEIETPAIAVLDGGKGLGHVAATKAMQMAIDKAKDVGTGTVAVKRSQHLGAASLYSLMATEANMIGYCTTSTGQATVAAYGSTQPGTANNAFAWGIPARSGPPIVLDMACAASSWGKITSLGMYGQPIPDGWALDENGQPTTDPSAAKTMLPASGARGYGLALICSTLAGPLVGGKNPLHKKKNPEVSGSEHFFYAIDVAQFCDLDNFHEEIDATVADLQALDTADGFDVVRLPGQLEAERAAAWAESGIPLHKDHVAELEQVASSMKVDVPWA